MDLWYSPSTNTEVKEMLQFIQLQNSALARNKILYNHMEQQLMHIRENMSASWFLIKELCYSKGCTPGDEICPAEHFQSKDTTNVATVGDQFGTYQSDAIYQEDEYSVSSHDDYESDYKECEEIDEYEFDEEFKETQSETYENSNSIKLVESTTIEPFHQLHNDRDVIENHQNRRIGGYL